MGGCAKLKGESECILYRPMPPLTCQPIGREKTMDQPVRWVTKAEAAEELEISLSTLDRKIRKGEVVKGGENPRFPT